MSNSLTVCVDASIVIRFTIGQDDVAVMQLWKSWASQEAHMVAPTLLFYEVTNGLYQQQKNGRLSPGFVREALDVILAFPIELIGDPALQRRARELAARYNLPASYDAHYLALADRMGIELWTADARLVKALLPFKLDWVKLAAG
ncbi:MAG: type II toxin-antitoxin system VapC family toxin [Anaerolineales bacterium]